MVWSELESLFINSRIRGTEGAKRKCSAAALHIYRQRLKQLITFMEEQNVTQVLTGIGRNAKSTPITSGNSNCSLIVPTKL